VKNVLGAAVGDLDMMTGHLAFGQGNAAIATASDDERVFVYCPLLSGKLTFGGNDYWLLVHR
jgi:hypothetical protein